MHDSAGHTFTMISSLSKIADIELRKDAPDKEALFQTLSEIDGLSRSGVTQLRCSINNLREDTFMNSVTQAIQTVIDSVRGVEVDFCTQGNEDERYSFCIREIYDNVRETITNSMRYSEASRIDIIAKFLKTSLEVYILDNGKGCRNIKESNGLKGIRQRTASLGGTVRFMSVDGEGFSTVIKLPVSSTNISEKET
jgi:signal transduction histidine kinase